MDQRYGLIWLVFLQWRGNIRKMLSTPTYKHSRFWVITSYLRSLCSFHLLWEIFLFWQFSMSTHCLTVTHGSCQDLWNAKYICLHVKLRRCWASVPFWCDILILLVLKSLKTYYQVFLNSIQVDSFSCMENAHYLWSYWCARWQNHFWKPQEGDI
jgi:hypothetical protein